MKRHNKIMASPKIKDSEKCIYKKKNLINLISGLKTIAHISDKNALFFICIITFNVNGSKGQNWANLLSAYESKMGHKQMYSLQPTS